MTELTSNEQSTAAEDKGQIHPDVLQNIPVTLSIEVGRAVIKIRDLLRLTQGSVVELDRIAGEPLDLLVTYGEVYLYETRHPICIGYTFSVFDKKYGENFSVYWRKYKRSFAHHGA